MTQIRAPWFAKKRIVITGGAGFLGRAVVEKLRANGCGDVFAVRRAEFDLTRCDNIERLFDSTRPEVLLHLAAATANPPGRSNAAASFYDNVMMSTQLIEAACRHGVDKILCLGSASSYPDCDVPLLAEGELFHGLPEAYRVAHGVAKRLPLIQAQAYRAQYGLACIFLIPTNLYGPGDNFDAATSYVIPSLIRRFAQAIDGRHGQVTLRGTGRAERDFLHVEDCAEGILLALNRYTAGDAVNLATGVGHTVRQLAQLISEISGYSGNIVWDGVSAGESPRRVLDPRLAEKQFGFRATWNLSDGLRQTISWYRKAAGSGQPQSMASHA